MNGVFTQSALEMTAKAILSSTNVGWYNTITGYFYCHTSTMMFNPIDLDFKDDSDRQLRLPSQRKSVKVASSIICAVSSKKTR
jgi:hypothetical protein